MMELLTCGLVTALTLGLATGRIRLYRPVTGGQPTPPTTTTTPEVQS